MTVKPVEIRSLIPSTFREFPQVKLPLQKPQIILLSSKETIGAILSLPNIGGLRTLQDAEETQTAIKIFKKLMRNQQFKKAFETVPKEVRLTITSAKNRLTAKIHRHRIDDVTLDAEIKTGKQFKSFAEELAKKIMAHGKKKMPVILIA